MCSSDLWEPDEWAERGERPLIATDERLWALLSELRAGTTPYDLSLKTGIDPWFTERFARLIAMERRLLAEELTPALLREAKRLGFGDAQIATLSGSLQERVRSMREELGIRPVYKMVDTCAAEFEAATPYFYSTYDEENEAAPDPGERVLVIGSGPIRIGQGIEFDYASVQEIGRAHV